MSPCLCNIYLDRLDKFVETVLLPEYTRGVRRSSNPEYSRVSSAIHRARNRGDQAAVRVLRKQQHSLPYADPRDPGYRRLRYVRYADDSVPRTRKEELSRSSVRRMWCCTRDEGAGPLVWWPFAAALQGEAANHREVRRSRAGVLSVAERRACERVEVGEVVGLQHLALRDGEVDLGLVCEHECEGESV